MPTSRTSAGSQLRTAGSSSARTTSTRRCPARGSGTSSGWRPAPRSPAATSGCRRIAGERIVTACVREYREGMRGFAEREPPRRLVRAPQRERARRSLRREAGREGSDRVREAVRQGAAQDEPAGGQEAHRARRRRAALSQRPAAAGPAPRAARPRRRSRRDRTTVGSCWTSTPPASTSTGATCSAPTGSSTWPARSSASAASARAPGCSCSSAAKGKDPLVLQAKEAQASVLEPYLGASEFENHGERVVRGQRISQAASDIFLELAAQRRPRRQGARLLRPPAVGLEGVRRPVDAERIGSARVHAGMWVHPAIRRWHCSARQCCS